jgi:peptide/nickel transport system substrate-binding protein
MIKSKKWLISMVLAVVLVVTFVLPGCDGAVTTAERLNIAITSLPNTLNMDQLDLPYTNLGCLYLMLVYEPLYAYPKVDEDIADAYDFAPRLVESYSWSYEGTDQILTLNLQEGVKWHDGEDFTADDVVFSFKSKVIYPWAPNMPVNFTWVYDVSNPDQWSITADDILVEKTGNHTAELRYVDGWHQPEAYLPNDFLWYSIVPEHVFGPDGEGVYDGWAQNASNWDGESIGTGPFKVKDYQVDDYILLERNEDYWGDLPAAKEVLFKLYTDENSMWLAFESNDPNSLMDLAIAGVPFPKKDAYEADSRIAVEVLPDLSISVLGFNLNSTYGYEPLQDLALREAIAASIDKENMCTLLAGGYAEPADSYVYLESENHYGGADNYGVLPNNAYNLTKAAQILTDAGYTQDGTPDTGYLDGGYWWTPGVNSTKISFEITTVPGHYDKAQLIAEDLNDFGLDISAAPMDSSSFYDILYLPNTEGALHAFVWADDPAPDPWSDWIWCYFADPWDWGYMWNPTWYADSEMNDLYLENYLVTDLERKSEVILRMQEKLAEDVPVIFLMRENIITACRTDRWENWFNEMGGYATWINDYSIREVTPVAVD